MGIANIHCISCGAETSDEGGRVKGSACGAEFEFTRVAAKPQGAVIQYPAPATDGDKSQRKIDRYCLAAVLVSLVSCVFPLIAAIAIGLAIAGFIRARKSGDRGIGRAITAMVLSVIGIGAFFLMMQRLNTARALAVNLSCESNLRQLGECILLYDNDHPRASGYTLEDITKAGGPSMAGVTLSCPDVEAPAGGKPTPTYVMLTSLQPFRHLIDQSGTVIAFELHTHHIPSDGEVPETNQINALFGDGHVESLPLDKAAGIIERSLLASRRERATRPSDSPAPTQPQ